MLLKSVSKTDYEALKKCIKSRRAGNYFKIFLTFHLYISYIRYIFTQQLNVNYMSIICNRCGQSVKDENAVRIYGKFYGQDCASTILGMKQMPQWFKGGDYDNAKAKHEVDMEKLNAEYERKKQLTADYYEEWYKLSYLLESTRHSNNEWLYNFVSSIINQLGYFNSLAYMDADTFEKYLKCPYCTLLHNEPKRISSLSPKQLNILNKYL